MMSIIQLKWILLTCLNGLSAIFSCQVERTPAVEVVGQVDAGGCRWAHARLAVINVLLAVASSITYKQKKNKVYLLY